MDAARILGETYPGHGKPDSAASAAVAEQIMLCKIDFSLH